MIHHGNKEVQKNDYIYDGKAAEHEQAPEAGETFDSFQLETLQLDETKYSPEKCLTRFKQAEKK